MDQTRLVHSRHVIVFQVLSLCFTMSQGAPKVILVNASAPLVIDAKTISEIYFSLEDVEDDNMGYVVYINHKYPGSNISALKCTFNIVSGNCSSKNEDCVCENEKSGHQFRLKKVFQENDTGEWTFSVTGKGVSHHMRLNISVTSPTTTTQSLQTSKEPVPAPVLKTDFFSHVQTSTMIEKLRGTTITTTRYSNDIDGDAARNKDCNDIFLIIVITCVVVVIVVSLACVLLIISVRYFINRFLWEHRHCLLSTDGIKQHADSLCELLTDRLQAETSFSRSRYSRPRKRRRSATLDDSSDNISYMCITDDDHGTYLTPADNDQREEAPILT